MIELDKTGYYRSRMGYPYRAYVAKFEREVELFAASITIDVMSRIEEQVRRYLQELSESEMPTIGELESSLLRIIDDIEFGRDAES